MENQSDDFDLVEGLYLGQMAARADGGMSSLSACERAVVIAWWAKGVIDNGGFSYLYEFSVDIDDVEAAFREVGAAVAADACVKSKSEFLRRQALKEGSSSVRSSTRSMSDENAELWDACDRAVWEIRDFDSIVADYVRAHWQELSIVR